MGENAAPYVNTPELDCFNNLLYKVDTLAQCSIFGTCGISTILCRSHTTILCSSQCWLLHLSHRWLSLSLHWRGHLLLHLGHHWLLSTALAALTSCCQNQIPEQPELVEPQLTVPASQQTQQPELEEPRPSVPPLEEQVRHRLGPHCQRFAASESVK